MSYAKNIWNEGDVITAEKLNNIEDGVSEVGEVYELELTEEEWSSISGSNVGEGFSKEISEEEYLKVKNCNQIKLITSSNIIICNKSCIYSSDPEILSFTGFFAEGGFGCVYLNVAKSDNIYVIGAMLFNLGP